jgi:hypothetical protein
VISDALKDIRKRNEARGDINGRREGEKNGGRWTIAHFVRLEDQSLCSFGRNDKTERRRIVYFDSIDHFLERALQPREVSLNHPPYFFKVDTKVIVNQYIPHGNNLWPRDRGILFVELTAKFRCSFSNNLKVVNNPGLNQFILFKFNTACGDVAFNPFNSFQHIQNSFSPISHNSTASRRTRSRMRGLIPRSLTTSTFRPRISCNASQRAAWSSKLRKKEGTLLNNLIFPYVVAWEKGTVILKQLTIAHR